jgi:glyceraldehyde 3-phosphate dehydrogenase
MTIKVAINGYGRIGRNVLRAHYEDGKKHDIAIVAVNDLGSPETNAHLTRYDTAHGKFPGRVDVEGDAMVVNGDRIRVLAERNPAQLPWASLGVDVVLECTGLFTTKEKASAHLKGGARKVIISAPGGKDVDATVVYGVNHQTLKASDTVISNASCTTNCLAPRVKPLHDRIGVVDVRRDADEGVRPARQGLELVRQRMGIQQSDAGRDNGVDAGKVNCAC